MHGYEMLQELSSRTHELWRPSPGSLYPALQLLEDQGLVVSTTKEGTRTYELTDSGREEVAADKSEKKPWETVVDGADPDGVALHEAVRALIPAIHQLVRVGNSNAKAQGVEVLNKARTSIYLLLAGQDLDSDSQD